MTYAEMGILAAVGVTTYIVGASYAGQWLRDRRRADEERFWIRVDVDAEHCAVCRLDAGQRNSIRLAQASRIVRVCEPHRERLVAFTFANAEGVVRLAR